MWYMYSTLEERELVFISMIALIGYERSFLMGSGDVGGIGFSVAGVKGVHQTLKGEGVLCFVDATRVGIKDRFVD